MAQNISFAMRDDVLAAGMEVLADIILSGDGNNTGAALFGAFLRMLQEVAGGEVIFYFPEDENDRGFSVVEIH